MCDGKLPTLALTEGTRMSQLPIFLVKYNEYTISSGTDAVSRHNPKVGCFRVRSPWTSELAWFSCSGKGWLTAREKLGDFYLSQGRNYCLIASCAYNFSYCAFQRNVFCLINSWEHIKTKK